MPTSDEESPVNDRDKREPRFTEVRDLDADNTVMYTPPVSDKGQLNRALRIAINEAQTLANYYDNVAKQLSLLADQVEQTK